MEMLTLAPRQIYPILLKRTDSPRPPLIPASLDRELLQNLSQRLHILFAQFCWLHILLSPRRRGSTRDWDDSWHTLLAIVIQNPPNCNLSWCDALLLCELFDCIRQLDVFIEHIGLVAGQVAEERVWLEVVKLFVFARLIPCQHSSCGMEPCYAYQKPSSYGRVCNDGNAELCTCRRNAILQDVRCI
jgi:hypothetical protein